MTPMKSTGSKAYAQVYEKNLEKLLTKNPLKKIAIKHFLFALREIVAANAGTESRYVIDLGCGEGIMLKSVFKGIGNCRVTGVDLSERALQTAKKLNPEMNFLKADILEFKPKKADLVICVEAMEHIREYRKLLSKIVSYSDKAVISVPNKWAFRLGNILQLRHLPTGGNTPIHVNEWTRPQLQKLLLEFFSKVEIRRAGLFWLIAICSKAKKVQ